MQSKDGGSRIQPRQMLLHRIFSQRQWHYRNCRCGVTISKLNVDMVVVLHKYCTDLWFTFQGKLSQVTTLITYGVMLPHLDQQCTQLMISFKCCLHAYKNIAPFSEKGGFLVTLSKKIGTCSTRYTNTGAECGALLPCKTSGAIWWY